MNHNVPEEIRQLLQGVRAFVAREIMPLTEEHASLLASEEITSEIFELCRRVQRASLAAGYFAMFMPSDIGGSDLGEYEMCLVREEVSRSAQNHLAMLMLGDLPFGPNKMLHALATEHQREKYLMPLMRAELTTGIALTEPEAGSDLAAIRTTAKAVDGGWVLNGGKHFISNAPFADFLQVLAKTPEGGFSMFLVDRDAYRIGSIQHTMGGDDLQAEVIFEDAFVPEQNIIGEPGKAFAYAVQFLGNERLAMASFAIGMADLALRLMKDYSKQRVTFGKPLSENQAIQWMVADSETELYAARSMCYDAAQRADHGEDVFKEIAMAKLYCSEMVGHVVDRAVQVFGGIGYTRGHTVERLYRLARVMRIAGGSSEIQRMIIARMS
ncbi:MAG TPA: acyl-CoA dehydrogenase family protein [Actinomycetota bacterium]|nr:acyl-CoA dehydrogenase family protein [Actinomycetota bacterium]